MGNSITVIDSFDHENSTPESKAAIKSKLSSFQLDYKEQVVPWNKNKIEKSFALIKRYCGDIFKTPPSKLSESRTIKWLTDLHKQIQNIYTNESALFDRLFNASLDSSYGFAWESFQQATPMDKIVSAGIDVKNKVKDVASKGRFLLQLLHQCDPSMAFLGGIGGALLPLCSAPFISPALIPTLIPFMIPSGLASAAVLGVVFPACFRSIRDKVVQSSLDKSKNNIKLAQPGTHEDIIATVNIVLRSNVLWTLVYELQGNASDDIAFQLPILLRPIEERTVKTANDISNILNAIQNNVCDFHQHKEIQ